MRAFATGRLASQQSELGLLFRGAAEKSRPDQRATIEYVAAFVDAALRVLPPQTSPPEWLRELHPREQTFGEAHRLAHRFRTLFMPQREEDAAMDLPQVLSVQAGVIIGTLRLSRCEGVSIIAGAYCFIFISPRFLARMLFTLAHELGHLIAHHEYGKAAIFDGASQIGAWHQRTLGERFVDAFASVLLLPEVGVARALKAIRKALNTSSGEIGDIEILYLARFFGE